MLVCPTTTNNVTKVCQNISGGAPLTFSHVLFGMSFPAFTTLTTDDVVNTARRLPGKSSAADMLPTTFLKQVIDLISPFITELYSRLLAADLFPVEFPQTLITAIVKKPGVDATEASSYRPKWNLSLLYKLLERLVARQLIEYMSSRNLLPARQSGFQPGHSTETAVLHMLSDMLLVIDHGDLAALILLFLTAAFDTVDHDILIQRLQMSFGVNDVALQWL